jgi:hypothetical protein
MVFMLYIFLAACSGTSAPAEQGNLAGNINNFGLAAIQGEWIYYSNQGDNGSLYKMKIDGTEKTKLNNSAIRYINVVGDWIYYSCSGRDDNDEYILDENGNRKNAIYKIRTDGKRKTELLRGSYRDITVAGDWVFFLAEKDLYKMRVDGKRKTLIISDINIFPYINIVGDWIYYITDDVSGHGYIWKIRIDGTENTRVNNVISNCINIVDDWIYYVNRFDNDYIYKIRTDGTDNTQINDDESFSVIVDGEWIYYIQYESMFIYRIRTDGTERTQLNNEKSFFVSVVGDWIYYFNTGDERGFYIMRTDGSQQQFVD